MTLASGLVWTFVVCPDPPHRSLAPTCHRRSVHWSLRCLRLDTLLAAVFFDWIACWSAVGCPLWCDEGHTSECHPIRWPRTSGTPTQLVQYRCRLKASLRGIRDAVLDCDPFELCCRRTYPIRRHRGVAITRLLAQQTGRRCIAVVVLWLQLRVARPCPCTGGLATCPSSHQAAGKDGGHTRAQPACCACGGAARGGTDGGGDHSGANGRRDKHRDDKDGGGYL